MNINYGLALMVGWSLVAALLSRSLGPRRATLIAVVGGNLVLPCLGFDMAGGRGLGFTQATAIGLAVGVAVLVGDPRCLSRIRPDWLDLPMLAFVACPLSGLITNGPMAAWDVGNMILDRALGTLVPYAAARRYLGDAEGARQVAIAIVVATLLFVPVIAYEAAMGPRWYLGRLLYGVDHDMASAHRLGGWRPEGFFLDGLMLAVWVALAAVTASWLWLWRGWRPKWGPSWWPSLVLVLASIGCRSVYGYITLGAGLAVVAISRALRTRWAVALLVLAAPLYIGLRVSGEWDARMLTRMAVVTGRPDSVDFRLRSEDGIITRVLERRPIVGFGVHIWHAPDIHESLGLWPDGQWLATLWSGGLAGLALELSTIYLIPAGLALTRPVVGRGPVDAGAPALGLALFSALCMLDGLHNHSAFTPRAIVAGSLVGSFVNRRRGPAPPGAPTGARPRPSARSSIPDSLGSGFRRALARLAVILALLAVPEVVGFLQGLGQVRPAAGGESPPRDHPGPTPPVPPER